MNILSTQKSDGNSAQKNDGNSSPKEYSTVPKRVTVTVPKRVTKKESKKKNLKKTVKKALPDLNFTSFTPKTFDDQNHVRNQIEKTLRTLCEIEPNRFEITRFFNIIMFTRSVRKPTAFRFFFQSCREFKKLEPAKANFKYLSSQIECRIKDAIEDARKKEDRQIINPGNVPDEVHSAVDKISFK